MAVDVKICGLKEVRHTHVAAEHGACWLGFVFFEPSPRNLTIEAARVLAPQLPTGPKRVGVFVNPSDDLLKGAVDALKLDVVQLHGKEDASEVARVKDMLGIRIIKALGVSEEADLENADAFANGVDRILFDAKPPKGAVLPGGNAVSFPWHILKGKNLPYRWMLAGGLTPENAAEAITASGAKALDISSGVETEPGKKSSELIEAFLTAVKQVK